MNCIFCKIINNEIPSHTVYEDEFTKVFLDINPDTDGHLLIIPKKHFQDISDIDIEDLNYMMTIVKKMSKLLEDKLNIDGLTILQNNGMPQEVKHFHIHLKPFYNYRRKTDIKEIYEKLK